MFFVIGGLALRGQKSNFLTFLKCFSWSGVLPSGGKNAKNHDFLKFCIFLYFLGIWGLGTIKIESGRSNNACRQNMSQNGWIWTTFRSKLLKYKITKSLCTTWGNNNNFFWIVLVICNFLVIISKRLLNPSFSEKPKKGGAAARRAAAPPFFIFSQMMDSEAFLKKITKK